jgi:hypothetical protein
LWSSWSCRSLATFQQDRGREGDNDTQRMHALLRFAKFELRQCANVKLRVVKNRQVSHRAGEMLDMAIGGSGVGVRLFRTRVKAPVGGSGNFNLHRRPAPGRFLE